MKGREWMRKLRETRAAEEQFCFGILESVTTRGAVVFSALFGPN